MTTETMIERRATILPALESPGDLDYLSVPSQREEEISYILANCFEYDRELSRLDQFIDQAIRVEDGCAPKIVTLHRPTTTHLSDVVGASHRPHADVATVLFGPVSRLVERCLDVDDEWQFDQWSLPKQARTIRALYEEAGIPKRFRDISPEPRTEDETGEPEEGDGE